MFKSIPIILPAQKLLDKSFKKANKIQKSDKNPLYKKRKTIIARIESFSNTIVSSFEQYIKKFPSIDKLPLFYQKLIEIKINKDQLKKSLGAVNWAGKTVQSIYEKQIRSLRRTNNLGFLTQKQKEIYGRISSVVNQIEKELMFLIDTQKILNSFPDIYDAPTVVIAGYPNVGKSSILKCLSSAKPTIAQYPFTTKEIYVGHLKIKDRFDEILIQLIDTPGLLDRPLEQKNKIEQQSIAALKFLADIIIFVYDSSESCGYSLADQKNLFKSLKEMFKESEFIVIENKIDIFKPDSEYFKISCETNEGIKELRNEIIKVYKKISESD